MGASFARGRAVAPIVIGLVLAAWFIWLFAAALHLPQAHELPVALVAPDAAAAQVTAGLERQAPGAFAVTTYGSEADARAAIADRDAVGALVVGAERGHHPRRQRSERGRRRRRLGRLHRARGCPPAGPDGRGRRAAPGRRPPRDGPLLPGPRRLALGPDLRGDRPCVRSDRGAAGSRPAPRLPGDLRGARRPRGGRRGRPRARLRRGHPAAGHRVRHARPRRRLGDGGPPGDRRHGGERPGGPLRRHPRRGLLGRAGRSLVPPGRVPCARSDPPGRRRAGGRQGHALLRRGRPRPAAPDPGRVGRRLARDRRGGRPVAPSPCRTLVPAPVAG